MGKIYFVFQEESILGLLKNYAAAQAAVEADVDAPFAAGVEFNA